MINRPETISILDHLKLILLASLMEAYYCFFFIPSFICILYRDDQRSLSSKNYKF